MRFPSATAGLAMVAWLCATGFASVDAAATGAVDVQNRRQTQDVCRVTRECQSLFAKCSVCPEYVAVFMCEMIRSRTSLLMQPCAHAHTHKMKKAHHRPSCRSIYDRRGRWQLECTDSNTCTARTVCYLAPARTYAQTFDAATAGYASAGMPLAPAAPPQASAAPQGGQGPSTLQGGSQLGATTQEAAGAPAYSQALPDLTTAAAVQGSTGIVPSAESDLSAPIVASAAAGDGMASMS